MEGGVFQRRVGYESSSGGDDWLRSVSWWVGGGAQMKGMLTRVFSVDVDCFSLFGWFFVEMT